MSAVENFYKECEPEITYAICNAVVKSMVSASVSTKTLTMLKQSKEFGTNNTSMFCGK